MRTRFENLPLVLLLGNAIVLLGTSAQHWITPAILLVLLMAYAVGFRIPTKPTAFLTMVLTVPFALWWQSLDTRFIMTQERYLMFIIAFYTLTMGMLHLLTLERGGKLTHATFGAIFAIAVAGLTSHNPYYLPGIVVTVVLLWWWLREAQRLEGTIRRRWQWVLPRLFVVVQIALLAVILQKFVVERSDDVDRWMQRVLGVHMLPGSRAGFSRTVQLGSMRDELYGPDREELMLRTFSDTAPGYMRGAAFDRYEHGRWWRIEESLDLDPVARERGRNLFELAEPPSTEVAATVYLLDDSLQKAYFLPLGVHQVTTFAAGIAWSPAWTLRPREDISLGGYEFYTITAPMPEPRPEDLSVPEAMRAPLEQIAADLTDPEAPAPTRLLQLQAALARDFNYRIGIDIPSGEDPLLAFLTDIRAGHCEYFAAAGTLLLRTMGIHARYVNGFVCQEPGPGDAYWQARRKDAHAWVEAWLPGKGWMTVEMTPPAGRPLIEPAHADKSIADYFTAQWERFKAFLGNGGLRGLIGMIWGKTTSLLLSMPIWGWVFIVGGGMAWIYRGALRKLLGARQDVAEVDPAIEALQGKLREAERLLAAHQIRRPPGMTVRWLRRQVAESALPEHVSARVLPLLEDYDAHRFRHDIGARGTSRG